MQSPGNDLFSRAFLVFVTNFKSYKNRHLVGLSAWGAGRRIENHQRERKTSFQRLKKRFGNPLEEIYNPFKIQKNSTIQYDEIEDLKNKKRYKRQIFQHIRNAISILFLILIIYIIYNFIYH